MSRDLRSFYEADKLLARRPSWIAPDSHNFRLVCPLDIDGVTVAGLEFCAYASASLPDEAVRFQLQYLAPAGKSRPFCRLDWRPISEHANNGRGPEHLKFAKLSGTHFHPFELNYNDSTGQLLRGNLPIAVPVEPDPDTFEELLALAGNLFKIGNLGWMPKPPWQPRII